jgi:hypothetical protein
LDECWRIVGIGSDGRTLPGGPLIEKKARQLFGRLTRSGATRIELQRREDDGWVTVEWSGLRIAPGT